MDSLKQIVSDLKDLEQKGHKVSMVKTIDIIYYFNDLRLGIAFAQDYIYFNEDPIKDYKQDGTIQNYND